MRVGALFIILIAVVAAQKISRCDNGAPIAEPDKCCSFPNLFIDGLIADCEKQFGLNDSSADILADSCVIECVFNKSGLNKNGKLFREDVLKILINNTKSDKVWSTILPNVIDTCFTERKFDAASNDLKLELIFFSPKTVSPEAIDEFVTASVTKELSDKRKIPNVCHPITSFILDCIYLELYKQCPTEKFQATNTSCVALQNYSKECDNW
jgi:hypothetical protein